MLNNRRAFITGLRSTSLSQNEKKFLKKYKPWGVILFSRNIKSFKQLKTLVDSIKKIFDPLPDFFTATITKNRFENDLSDHDLEFVDSENFKLIEKWLKL